MNLIDLISETYQSIKRHKVRNILTGFGVSWGIFILVILLGSGEGLQQGIYRLFASFAKSSIWVYAGETSESSSNSRIGEPILFNDSLLMHISRQFPEIKYSSSELSYTRQVIVSHRQQTSIGELKGVGKDYFNIKLIELSSGRTFNNIDFSKDRPVCIIGYQVNKLLADKNSNLIGHWINVSGQLLLVVGIMDEGSTFTQGEQNSIYTSTITFRQRYNSESSFSTIGILLKDKVDTKNFEKNLNAFLANRLHFKPTDSKALYIANISEQVKSFEKLFSGLKFFIWFMGLGLLLSGIIGVGNMSSTTVRERTSEIGLRKALGAKPSAILLMILMESVSLTLVSGLIGMFMGYFVISIGNIFLSSQEESLIQVLSVDYMIIVQAIFVLTIVGCFAGVIPAKDASEIVPVKALNRDS